MQVVGSPEFIWKKRYDKLSKFLPYEIFSYNHRVLELLDKASLRDEGQNFLNDPLLLLEIFQLR